MERLRNSRLFALALTAALVVSLSPRATWADDLIDDLNVAEDVAVEADAPGVDAAEMGAAETDVPEMDAASPAPEDAVEANEEAPAPAKAMAPLAAGVWQMDGASYDTLADALAAAGFEATIILSEDTNESVAASIPAGKNITIDLGGKTLGVSLGDISKSYLTLASGATLSLENGTLQGSQDGRAIESSGTLSIKDATVKNFASTGNGGAVLVSDGTAQISSTVFSGNRSLIPSATTGNTLFSGGGAVALDYRRGHVIEGCTFTENYTNASGGALFLAHHDTATIKDTVFSSNTAGTRGGAVHLVSVAETVLFDGCTIEGNEVVQETSGTTMAGSGGGMSIMMLSSGSKSIIRNCTISNNTADGPSAYSGRGGGIRFYNLSGTTEFEGLVTISGNTARMGGGIDYTVHNQQLLQLNNVLVANNTATRGGGVWSCPDGSVITHSTYGASILNNTATGEPIYPLFQTANAPDPDPNPVDDGDPSDTWRMIKAGGTDIQNEGDDSYDVRTQNSVGSLRVDTRGPAGTLVTWYNDIDRERYSEGDEPADPSIYTDTTKSFSLVGKPDGSSWEEYGYALRIVGNTALLRGGGIATNSPIRMGVDVPCKEVSVEKTWSTSPHPDKVLVDLYRIDNGDASSATKLDSNVVLSEENQWKTKFDKLPAYGLGADGNQVEYSYTVKEQPVGGWIEDASARVEQTEGLATKVVITNTPLEPAEESILVEKRVEGTPSNDETFTFSIEAGSEDAPLPETSTLQISGEGSGAFGPIKFERTGTFVYTITETQPVQTPEGWTFDKSSYHVVFDVQLEGAKLKATKSISKDGETAEAVEFVNAYEEPKKEPEPTQATIEVQKTLAGDPPSALPTFTFALAAETEGAPMPAAGGELVNVQGAGTASFGSITFDKAGIYVYRVTEQQPDPLPEKWVYDTSVFTLSYTVEEVDGALVATPRIEKDGAAASAVEFTNAYYEPLGNVSVVVVKHLEDALIHAEEFSFGLYDADGKLLETVHTTLGTHVEGNELSSSVTIAFESLVFTQPGAYNYVIREHLDDATEVVEGDENNLKGFEPGFYYGGVKYDDKDYPVLVSVEDVDGKLAATVSYPGSDDPQAHELHNYYNEEYVEIDGNDSHPNDGKHEEPTPEPTPDPKKGEEEVAPPKQAATPTAAPVAPKLVSKAATTATPKGGARTGDEAPAAPIAVVALLAAGGLGLAMYRRRNRG